MRKKCRSPIGLLSTLPIYPKTNIKFMCFYWPDRNTGTFSKYLSCSIQGPWPSSCCG